MGDRLLKEISARLLRCIRSRTTPSASAAMSSRSSSAPIWTRSSAAAWPSASRPCSLRLSLSKKKCFRSGVSCGCACYPEDGDASQVRITADSRMYAEKQHHHEDDRTEEQS